jgi:hypothetical protein
MFRRLQIAGLLLVTATVTWGESTNPPVSTSLPDPAACVEQMQQWLADLTKLRSAITNDAVAAACLRAKHEKLQTTVDLAQSIARRLRTMEQVPLNEERLDEERVRLLVAYRRAEKLAVSTNDCIAGAVVPSSPTNRGAAASLDDKPTNTVSSVPIRRIGARKGGTWVSQGETATMLAQAMDLVVDSRQETIACAELAQKGIEPPGGWDPAKHMTLADFYVLVSKVLGLADGSTDPVVCARNLRTAGLPVDTLLPPHVPDRSVNLLESEVRLFLATGRAGRP